MINSNFNIQGGSAWWAMGSNRNQMLRSMTNAQFGFTNGSNQSTSSADLRSALVSARRGADETRSVVNDLRRGNNTFTTMESSDTDVLTVNSSGRLSSMAGGMTVQVEQLARNQRNEGNYLTSNELATDYGFDVGMNQITIDIGNRSFNFSFQVSATDTTRDVQDRIANAINVRSDVAVQATVTTNADSGTSRLTFESTEPGVARGNNQPNFTITSNTGNAMTMIGGTNVTQQAQNAEFRINRTNANGNTIQGALQTSRTNDVQLGFGVSATLESTGTAEITPARDNIGQQNILRRMVNGLNDMVEAANGAGGNNRLQRELSNLARSSASALERIGITRNSEGFFRIDETRMANAAESGELDRFISSASSGGSSFMNRLDRIAGDVNRRPETMLGQDTDRFGGSRPNRWTNQLNQMMGFGMLFDTNM